MRSKIAYVAIILNGKTYSLPAPNRHHDVIRLIVKETGLSHVDGEEGFLDEEVKFLNREQALISAMINGQVLDESKVRAGELTSEDIW